MRSTLLIVLVVALGGCQLLRSVPTCFDDGDCPTDLPVCVVDTGACVAAAVPPPPRDAGPDPIADAGEPLDAATPPPDAGRPIDAGERIDGGAPDAGPIDAGQPDAGPPDAGPIDAGPQCPPAPELFLDFDGNGSNQCFGWSESNTQCVGTWDCGGGDLLEVDAQSGSARRVLNFRDFDREVELCIRYGEDSGATESTIIIEVDANQDDEFRGVYLDEEFNFGDQRCEERCVDLSAIAPEVEGDSAVEVRVRLISDDKAAADALRINGLDCP